MINVSDFGLQVFGWNGHIADVYGIKDRRFMRKFI